MIAPQTHACVLSTQPRSRLGGLPLSRCAGVHGLPGCSLSLSFSPSVMKTPAVIQGCHGSTSNPKCFKNSTWSNYSRRMAAAYMGPKRPRDCIRDCIWELYLARRPLRATLSPARRLHASVQYYYVVTRACVRGPIPSWLLHSIILLPPHRILILCAEPQSRRKG